MKRRMTHRPLGETGLLPVVRERVLALLLLNPGTEYHARGVAARCGVAANSAARELRHLEGLGIVGRRVRGRQTLYSANEACPYYAELRGWLTKTVGVVEPVRRALEGVSGVRLAFVYGSFAEGTATAESDVDLLVVGKVGLRQLSPALREMEEALGREVSPVVVRREGLRRRLSEGDHFLSEVLQRPRMWVIGGEDDLADVRG